MSHKRFTREYVEYWCKTHLIRKYPEMNLFPDQTWVIAHRLLEVAVYKETTSHGLINGIIQRNLPQVLDEGRYCTPRELHFLYTLHQMSGTFELHLDHFSNFGRQKLA